MNQLKPKHRIKISIKDLDTEAEHNTFYDNFNEENLESDLQRISLDLTNDFLKGARMKPNQQQDEQEFAKAAEQKQDLTHHKTEETDTLVKAENPADDFMKQNDLDKKTHGKLAE